MAAVMPSGERKIAAPATNRRAPAFTTAGAVAGAMPPSTWMAQESFRSSIIARKVAIFSIELSMKVWPPKPGLTDMTRTWSTSGRMSAMVTRGVAGFTTTPAFLPRRWICWRVAPVRDPLVDLGHGPDSLVTISQADGVLPGHDLGVEHPFPAARLSEHLAYVAAVHLADLVDILRCRSLAQELRPEAPRQGSVELLQDLLDAPDAIERVVERDPGRRLRVLDGVLGIGDHHVGYGRLVCHGPAPSRLVRQRFAGQMTFSW